MISKAETFLNFVLNQDYVISQALIKKKVKINDKYCDIEYDFSENPQGGHFVFGNIYAKTGQVLEFTFSAIENKILAYTPFKWEEKIIRDIYMAILKDNGSRNI